jgi:hypothetical protein
LLKSTSELSSQKRSAEHAATVHLSNQYEISDFNWLEENMRQDWPNIERIYTQILGHIGSHTREKVALLGSVLILLIEIALRLLGLSNMLTLGSISGLEEAKRVFVETATTLSYSLTGFALTGLAVVAVAAIVYNQDRDQFNNDNRPPPWDPDEEPNENDDLEYEPDHQQVRIRRLTKTFKQGIFLSISASILGIIFQSINSSLPELSPNVVLFVQSFNEFLLFYLFLGIFTGMVLTAVDITELIVGVVDDRT